MQLDDVSNFKKKIKKITSKCKLFGSNSDFILICIKEFILFCVVNNKSLTVRCDVARTYHETDK